MALQFLYMHHARGAEVMHDLNEFLLEESDKPEAREFARRLIEGVISQRDSIDKRIETVAHNWRLERMAWVDLNILRLAIYELTAMDDIPPIVAINEAIELAKSFSTEKSSAFVNGILDKIHAQARAPVAEKPL